MTTGNRLLKEELSEILALQDRDVTATRELGVIDLERAKLDSKRAQILGFVAETENRRSELRSTLVEKYGNIQINPETGIFTKIEE